MLPIIEHRHERTQTDQHGDCRDPQAHDHPRLVMFDNTRRVGGSIPTILQATGSVVSVAVGGGYGGVTDVADVAMLLFVG